MVIGMPLVFLLVLLMAQTALYFHATHIAQATATHALAATRVENGSVAVGESEGQYVLAQLGRSLQDARVVATRGSDRAEVQVSGAAVMVIPFMHIQVRARAAGPVEVFAGGGAAP